MKPNLIIFAVFSFLFFSCNDTVKDNSAEPSATTTDSPQMVAETLPSITVEIMQKLFDKCDYVDYLFYATNFSMSMNNKQSIQQTLTHVSEKVPTINPNCKAIGRVFYEIEGNTEIEAEIFFNDDCQYLVFMKDNKRIYANNLTADGVAHFNNIFQQAQKMNKQ